MSLVPNLALGGSSGNQGYNIQRSLRFRSSASANLTRTFGSGNQTTSTLSLWCKRGKIGSQQNLMGVSGGGSNDTELFFGADDLTFTSWNGGSRPLGNITTTAVFRDTSAWYHIVLVVDTSNVTSTERLRLYVNGIRQTVTGAYPSQNATWYWNGANAHTIGVYANPTGQAYFDGYLAEVNFIDGQALTPSSFGQTDPVTGVWQPKKYAGTYGTNGFYLPFTDNSSPTTLGYDKSGNGNNWTANNISTTAGSTYDSMLDVPTLTSATAANYCTLNPLNNFGGASISSGNLNITTASGYTNTLGTVGMTSGKWYWEVSCTSGYLQSVLFGIAKDNMNMTDGAWKSPVAWSYCPGDAKFYTNSVGTVTTGSALNDIIGIAFDATAGSLAFYKNGTLLATPYTGLIAGPYFPLMADGDTGLSFTGYINFGQRPFSYTPPTGFVALNTFNLPDPTIKKPNQYFDVATWTAQTPSTTLSNNGDGTWNINLAGITTGVDLAWGKCRNVGHNNVLNDSVRGYGSGKNISSNQTQAEGTDNDGYVVSTSGNTVKVNTGNGWNGTYSAGQTYVGWFWKKGATPGFDIVTYTGDGTTPRNISHSLGVAPKMMIVKNRSIVQTWQVYHASMGAANKMNLNATDAASPGYWNSTAPTASVFTVTNDGSVNANGNGFVNYLFAEIAGFSKFGSYTGNASADGPFVYCGFRPKFILHKRTDSSGTYWGMHDTSRDTYNIATKYLYANLSNAEYDYGSAISFDIVSNGFKIRGTDADYNASGGTYIYAAFAENPFKYSLAR